MLKQYFVIGSITFLMSCLLDLAVAVFVILPLARTKTYICIVVILIFLQSVMHFSHVDYDIGFDSGGNADYTMDLHQKEQLHDNTLSMMQSQHFSVSLYVKLKFSNSKCYLFVLSDTSFLHSADREICWVQLRRGLFILSSSAATATCPSCQ
jgi:hypothetical protein